MIKVTNPVFARVPMRWAGITLPLKAGSPVSLYGYIANNANAIGLVADTVLTPEDFTQIVVGGEVKKADIDSAFGTSIADAAVYAMDGIRFYGTDGTPITAPNSLPAVTASDNGKSLVVTEGAWAKSAGAMASSADLQQGLATKMSTGSVSASASGSSTTEVQYLTIEGTEYKLGGGGGGIGKYVHYITIKDDNLFYISFTIINDIQTAYSTISSLSSYIYNTLGLGHFICASGTALISNTLYNICCVASNYVGHLGYYGHKMSGSTLSWLGNGMDSTSTLVDSVVEI